MVGFPRPRASREVVTACTDADSMVHLALADGQRTLCGQAVRERERPSFRTAGCRDCLMAALQAHLAFARESDRVWINLTRGQR